MSDDGEDEYLTELQTILDNLGFNSKEGVDRLSNCIIDGAEFDDFVNRLSVATNMSNEQAEEKLMEWRSVRAHVRAKVAAQEEEMEVGAQHADLAMRRVWTR
jgi:hypothetical protein